MWIPCHQKGTLAPNQSALSHSPACLGKLQRPYNLLLLMRKPKGLVAFANRETSSASQHVGKVSKDHEKENLRRMREIQKRCREKEQAQELSRPKPVKALWKSQKYENVESKVKAKLQVLPSRQLPVLNRPSSTQRDR